MDPKLNVTSYAILGLLAMRDWTAYDLTKEMQRNLIYFWPRAESAIYVEAKRLRDLGLATARVEMNGRRRRTTYSITPAGRTALETWLATPAGRGVQLESEGLLRIFVAGALPPEPEAMLRALDALEHDANELITKGLLVGKDFLDGVSPFQDQLRWRAHTHDFLERYALLLMDWVQRTREHVAAWEHEDEDATVRAARAVVAGVRRELLAATERMPPPDPTDEGTADDSR